MTNDNVTPNDLAPAEETGTHPPVFREVDDTPPSPISRDEARQARREAIARLREQVAAQGEARKLTATAHQTAREREAAERAAAERAAKLAEIDEQIRRDPVAFLQRGDDPNAAWNTWEKVIDSHMRRSAARDAERDPMTQIARRLERIEQIEQHRALTAQEQQKKAQAERQAATWRAAQERAVEMLKDFPALKRWVEGAGGDAKEVVAKEVIDEINRRRSAGELDLSKPDELDDRKVLAALEKRYAAAAKAAEKISQQSARKVRAFNGSRKSDKDENADLVEMLRDMKRASAPAKAKKEARQEAAEAKPAFNGSPKSDREETEFLLKKYGIKK